MISPCSFFVSVTTIYEENCFVGMKGFFSKPEHKRCIGLEKVCEQEAAGFEKAELGYGLLEVCWVDAFVYGF